MYKRQVFGRRNAALLLHTPTLTAGIRGTGCYTEVREEGVYFCTCYGAIDLRGAAGAQELVVASRHDARLAPRSGPGLQPAGMTGHTDQEMDALERLVGRRAPWTR